MGFPGCLDRCEHGEYIDRQCIYCEVKKLKLENEELKKMLEEKNVYFNETLAQKAAERCRGESGPCWCGCHISTTMDG